MSQDSRAMCAPHEEILRKFNEGRELRALIVRVTGSEAMTRDEFIHQAEELGISCEAAGTAWRIFMGDELVSK